MTKRNIFLLTIALTCLGAACAILWLKPGRLNREAISTGPIDRRTLPRRKPRDLPAPTSAAPTREDVERELDAALPGDPVAAEARLFELAETRRGDYVVQGWITATIYKLPVDDGSADRHFTYVREKSGEVRDYAWRLLLRHKTLPPSVTPVLLEWLEGQDLRAADYSAQALRKVDPPATEAVGPLLHVVRRDSPHSSEGGHNNVFRGFAYSAVMSLRVMGAAEPEVIAALTDLGANEEAYEIEWRLARSIKQARAYLLGRRVTEANARLLVETLGDDDGNVRAEAAEALAPFGPWADLVVPPLIDCLDDDLTDVRTGAVIALGALIEYQPEPVTLALVGMLADDDIAVRVLASEALGRRDRAATPAIDALVRLLDHRDDDVRWRAVTALGDFHAARAAAALRGRFQDSHPGIRRSAEAVLARVEGEQGE